ncbi:translation elongation factor 4 [bacterium]|nr:translation elongation factor 4 [bacterium]NUN44082.1 elongation factor 4 [bacterium]HMV26873.1 translation elongation factor 4 [bacterium]HMW33728.1 translation elongation factor 4 [bacterium]HMY34773.1 translation elongation factor 4 [bacterium]
MSTEKIRNFCIVAHIDHGKSTLADRLLEYTKTISKRDMEAQVLDNMDLEKERGITIKAHAIRMEYKARNGQTYVLNLIDTPGHVDFTYEVSRSLAACEGAILVVDASQGIEAQTISNLYLAIDAGLQIVPVVNKIDLPSAQPEETCKEIIDLIGCKREDIVLASAKAGIGIEDILEKVVESIPAPVGDPTKPLQALIFDSVFDPFRGAIAYVRVFQGELVTGTHMKFFSNDCRYDADEIGYLRMDKIKADKISVGEVGYVVGNVREITHIRVGDTVTDAGNPAPAALEGYKDIKPMVFSGIYPTVSEDFEELRTSLEKLKLNDSSLIYEPESSTALGFGFRCGFLGLLHMEIVQERLQREFNISMITTVPSVRYQVYKTNGEVIEVSNPSMMPSPGIIDHIEEPYIKAQIITPTEYIGNIMSVAMERRGVYRNTNYISPTRVDLTFEFPLAEIVFDFYDKLKSCTKGYASFDYEYIGYKEGELVKLDILINSDPVDAFSGIIHRDKAYEFGRKMCEKLKELIPRQMFEVVIQAAIGSKIIARDQIRAMRKDVTAKCYGGDISRKRKLLERQKEGKKRMKQVGKVEIPQEAFLAVLKIGDE